MNPSLRKNSNYPPMSDSEWASAPFNIADPPEKDFNIAVSCSLSKDTTITTDDYDEIADDYFVPNEVWNTYVEQEYTPDQIIDFAKHCVEDMLNKHDYSIKNKYQLRKMLDSCNGWAVDEENVEHL